MLAVRIEPSDFGPGGISLVVVEKGTPGFSLGRKLEKMGYHMQDTAELFFEDCRVPAGNLLATAIWRSTVSAAFSAMPAAFPSSPAPPRS